MQKAIRPYLGDRAFYRGALSVMIPVVFQQLINSLFNFVDNVMVASIDELSMSAVTVANKPVMLYTALFFGFAGAAGILLSQYYGAGKRDVCQRIFSVEMLLGVLVSLIFALILYLFPERVMRLFVKDPYTVRVGVGYLRVVAWSYLPAALSSVCIFSLRSLGINFLPMLVSVFAICCNAVCNWVMIFGKLGFPAMGVRGAALGTVLARSLEAAIYIAVLLSRKTPFSLRLAEARRIGRPLLRSYLKRVLPLTLNEVLWSGGLLTYFWVYARIDETALPAINVADQLYSIAWVFFIGMSSAVSVMIGRHLGAGEFEQAKRSCKRLFGLGVVISAVCVVVAVTGAQFIGAVFPKLSPRQIAMAKTLIYILAFFFPFNAIYGLCFYVLRAGGDTKRAMLIDSVYMWVAPVPVALAMGILLRDAVDIRLTMFVVQLLMNLRLILALRVIRRGTWLNNLTRETDEPLST